MSQILIISGEASGDQHGAKLVTEVKKIDPSIQFLGMGSDAMRKVGVDIRVESKPLAVIGGIEVLSHFLPIYRAWRTVRRIIKKEPITLLVLIDYPGFNLRMAKVAKKRGIKVLYYISPQVWAWKQYRVKTIRKYVDKMLVIFPFEEKFYKDAGVPVEYVGHPLAGTVKPTELPETVRHKLNIEMHSRVVGLLPGSRKGEIKRLLPIMLEAAEHLKKQYPHVTFILPLASSLSLVDIDPYLKTVSLPIHVVHDQFYNVLQLCEAAIVASGTATLEVSLLEVPMVIIYKAAASTYHLLKRIIKIPYIGLCNIIAGRFIVKELIQEEANSQNIASEISHILDNPEYRNLIRGSLKEVKIKLGDGGASARVAKSLLGMLA